MKASLVALFLLTLVAPGVLSAQDRVHCSSREFRDNYCPADTRYGVQIVRQTSRARCEEGRSWGYDRRGIWVSGGCEAEFIVGGRGGKYIYDDRGERWREGDQYDSRYVDRSGQRYGQSYGAVLCESRDFRYRHCAIGGGREVELVRQISKTECRYGATWGHDGGGVWVDRGCAAEFAVR